MKHSFERYERRAYHYANLLKLQTEAINRLSSWRLVVFLIGAVITILLYTHRDYYLFFGAFIATLALFIYLIIMDNDLEKRKNLTAFLLKINEDSKKRLKGEWKNFQDSGSEFSDREHPFSEDLDLFGKGSLFQWTNVAKTLEGRNRFAQILKEPLQDVKSIEERQRAILELSKQLKWRQHFQAEGESLSEKVKGIENLKVWVRIKYPFYRLKWVQYMAWLLPITTLCLIICSFLKVTSFYFPLSTVVVQALLLRYKKNEHKAALDSIYPCKKTLLTYENLLKHIEEQSFEASLIKRLKEALLTKDQKGASYQIHKLLKIADGISNRMNAMYMIADILLLWDFHLMIALEKWKHETGHLIHIWLETIAEMEALSSLAILPFDNPDWCIPTLIEDEGVASRHLGHPLLGENKKSNSIELQPAATLLITGSNMSGKSTLLRTVGINLILAYTGAPVCAKQMTCGIMELYTCMRVSDDLDQSISSFYAELLRIKKMVARSREKKNVFFLLDEVFKGTNSEDRHQGAKVLIKQLNRQGATGLVSTHDLELGALEEEMKGRVKNFHFREYYENNEIHFDYVLRAGVSNTKNALYLIKMAGIEVEE